MQVHRDMMQISSSLWALLFLSLCSLPCRALPSALSVPASPTEWYGVDGKWSAVTVRLGSPPQWVDVLPSTSGSETLAIGLSGCDSTAQCRKARGGLFNMTASTSWNYKGNYEVALDRQLGYNSTGTYGFDTIALSDSASLQSQTLSAVNDTSFWNGMLGLGIKGSNFGETKTSLLYNLAKGNVSVIPSQSYGYTAGAIYELKRVPSSLTLGGYDSSRLIPNNVNFDLDSVQNPTLAVKSISVSGVENGGKIDLLTKSEADLFTIDSTTPFLWLPEKVCARFEQALGLQYDEKLQVYIYPRPEQQLALTSKNLTFEFSLSDLPASSDREILLSLSGNAFLSHSLSFGYPNWNGTYITPGQPYFPLRKAANSSQFVLGRSFLQETYLIVDFERNNFSLSQAKFPTNSNSPTLVDIYSPDIQIITRDQSSGSLNLALIIGASVGGVVGVILIAMAIYCCIRIRRRKASKISHPSPMYNEKDTDREFRHEVHSDTIKRELAVSEQALATELPGSGQDKGKSFLTPPDHNLRIPVELPETTIPKPVYELMSRQGTGSHQFKPRPSPLGDPIGDDARSSPSLMASSPAFTPISPSSWRNSEHSQIVSPMASNPPTPHQRHFRHNTHSNAPDTPPIFAPITVPNSYFPPREGTPAGSVRGEGSSEVEPDPEATDADSIYSRETTQTGYSSTLYPAPLRISRQIVPDRPR